MEEEVISRFNGNRYIFAETIKIDIVPHSLTEVKKKDLPHESSSPEKARCNEKIDV